MVHALAGRFGGGLAAFSFTRTTSRLQARGFTSDSELPRRVGLLTWCGRETCWGQATSKPSSADLRRTKFVRRRGRNTGRWSERYSCGSDILVRETLNQFSSVSFPRFENRQEPTLSAVGSRIPPARFLSCKLQLSRLFSHAQRNLRLPRESFLPSESKPQVRSPSIQQIFNPSILISQNRAHLVPEAPKHEPLDFNFG